MKFIKWIFCGAVFGFASFSGAEAKMVTQDVLYEESSIVLQGFLAYDDSVKAETQPGIVIVHEWTGLGDYVKGRAKQMAALGYVAFAADIYGRGIRPTNPTAAAAEAGKYKSDRNKMRARIQAAVDKLKFLKLADNNRLGAMGYCFGGTTVLELARSGSPDVKAVVSFHGGLETPMPANEKTFKAKVLALHGGDDPYVTRKEAEGFQAEMSIAKADWELVVYGGAVHSFTNPEAGNDNSKGAAYNKRADERSFQAMKAFFAETLGAPTPIPAAAPRNKEEED
jgi:dienelactone hydrolase